MTDPRRDGELESSVRAALDATGVAYELMPCDPAFADTAAFCERYTIAPDDSANTIVVASKKDPKSYVACVVLATTRLDVNGVVKRRMAAGKVSFATAEETVGLTGMVIGGVTPFALPDDLAVWVDARVMQRPSIILGGGSRAMKVRCSPDALTRLQTVEVVDELALAPTP
jgi:prolyl-tRNA editing enzyme YbaK/EbsC (Cys-tRNA(Pro) deacylase)